MSTYHTDDLGLSPEFLDPANFEFERDEVEPHGNKSCVCGREVIRFDVYRYTRDCFCDSGESPRCDARHDEPDTIAGIVGVLADGSTCCSAFGRLSERESIELAAEFNAREYVALSQEV